jgi:hypothetical protein
MICDRCGKQSISSTMSYFNTDTICPECDDRERAHPRFQEARDAELEACKRGDYNFHGIGLPAELAR